MGQEFFPPGAIRKGKGCLLLFECSVMERKLMATKQLSKIILHLFMRESLMG